MRRFLPAAACLAALLLVPLPVRAARSPSSAAALFAKAEKSFSALRASTKSQRLRQNYTRVLDAYRRVFDKFPATRQGQQSLMRSGELMTLLFRWTGQEADLNQAQHYYQRLVRTAPKSALVDDALLAIAYLYLDHFKDPAEAWLRFREVARHSPRGDKSAEARRQLKRLAKFAPAEKIVQAPGPPTAAPNTIIAATPPPVIAMPAPAIISLPRAGFQSPDSPPDPSSTPGMPLVLNRVSNIRHWSNPEYSRVVIELDGKTNFYSNLLADRSDSGQPPRLYVDLFTSLAGERILQPISVNDGVLHGIRAGQYTPDIVRVVLDLEELSTYRIFPMQDPFRIVIDVTGGAPVAGTAAAALATDPEPDAVIEAAAGTTAPAAPAQPLSARLSPMTTAPRYTPAPVPKIKPLQASVPPVTFSGAIADSSPKATPPPPPNARPSRGIAPAPATGTTKPSLARQLGLGVRRVVIDAGHGAHDPGAIGVDGLQEKDVTLDIALRVRDILQAAGYETVLTRDRDVYLPLEERTAIANTVRGDLFLSLHCNASDAGRLSGVETYFLNLASSERSMRTAARENSMAVANMSDLQQIVREIQNSKMDESSQFAARVQDSLYDALHRKYPDVKNLGVKQAPFYVLIGAQMPSILAEISFINHPKDGRRLSQPAYRTIIAKAIADGVKRYVQTVKSASLAPVRPTL